MSRMTTTQMSTFGELCTLVASITADAPTGGAWLWKGDEVLVDAGYVRRLDTDGDQPVTAQSHGGGLAIEVGGTVFSVPAELFRRAHVTDRSDEDERELHVAMTGRLRLMVRMARAAPGLRAV